jgi:hypothetical protein
MMIFISIKWCLGHLMITEQKCLMPKNCEIYKSFQYWFYIWISQRPYFKLCWWEKRINICSALQDFDWRRYWSKYRSLWWKIDQVKQLLFVILMIILFLSWTNVLCSLEIVIHDISCIYYLNKNFNSHLNIPLCWISSYSKQVREMEFNVTIETERK